MRSRLLGARPSGAERLLRRRKRLGPAVACDAVLRMRLLISTVIATVVGSLLMFGCRGSDSDNSTEPTNASTQPRDAATYPVLDAQKRLVNSAAAVTEQRVAAVRYFHLVLMRANDVPAYLAHAP